MTNSPVSLDFAIESLEQDLKNHNHNHNHNHDASIGEGDGELYLYIWAHHLPKNSFLDGMTSYRGFGLNQIFMGARLEV